MHSRTLKAKALARVHGEIRACKDLAAFALCADLRDFGIQGRRPLLLGDPRFRGLGGCDAGVFCCCDPPFRAARQ
jgi:hypothetical protein